MPTCVICGHQGFKTYNEYKNHHERHNIRRTSEGLVIDAVEPIREYVKMDAAQKQTAVEKMETNLRVNAWNAVKLNPLIGTDNFGSEPTWDEERNLI